MEQLPAINLNSISFKNVAACGYCQGRKSNKLWVTTGFECQKISPQAYEVLMERGWRRCGVYYYTPHIFESCCQAYTIRLDTYNFRLRYSHQKVLRKIRHIVRVESQFLPTQEEEQKQQQIFDKGTLQMIEQRLQLPPEYGKYLKEIKMTPVNKNLQMKNLEIPSLYAEIMHQVQDVARQFCHNLLKHVDQIINTIGHVEECNLPTVRERLQEFIYLTLTQHKVFESKNCAIAINCTAMLYSLIWSYWNSELKVRLPILSHSEFIDLMQEIIDVQTHNQNIKVCIKRGNQMICDNDKMLIYRNIKTQVFKQILLILKTTLPSKKAVRQIQDEKQYRKDLMQHTKTECPIQVKWVKAHFQQESFDLYCNYQQQIHGKEYCSKESYMSFLCQSAIQEREYIADDGEKLECGCWHMKYYLDETLIAVGVVDILLQGVSSVYFFYDPSYRKYSLGVYGALREVEFIQQKQKSFPYLQFYYLGFYIQDSSKMVYKGDYEHSDLLCPVTKTWVPLTNELKDKIDQINKQMIEQSELASELKAFNSQSCEQDNSDQESFIKENVNLLVGQKLIKITQIKQQFSAYLVSLFKQLLPLIGRDLLTKFLFKYNRG